MKLKLLMPIAVVTLSACGVFQDTPHSCRPVEGLPCMSLADADNLATNHPEVIEHINAHQGTSTADASNSNTQEPPPWGGVAPTKGGHSHKDRAQNKPTIPLGTIRLPNTGILPGHPVYRDPTIARVWFAPWEDGNGLLHDQEYVYMVLDRGGWALRMQQMDIEQAVRAEEIVPVHETPLHTTPRNSGKLGRPQMPGRIPGLPPFTSGPSPSPAARSN